MSFIANLSWRYATKKFDPQRIISDQEISNIFQSIKMAPTSFGLQPFHVINVQDKAKREELRSFSWDQPQVTDASHFLVFCAKTDIKSRIENYFQLATGGNEEAKNAMAFYRKLMDDFEAGLNDDQKFMWASKQAYIALAFALAACAEMKIDSCPMEGFDSSQFSKALNLPENIKPVACLAIGHRSESDNVRPKVRFSLDDLLSNF